MAEILRILQNQPKNCNDHPKLPYIWYNKVNRCKLNGISAILATTWRTVASSELRIKVSPTEWKGLVPNYMIFALKLVGGPRLQRKNREAKGKILQLENQIKKRSKSSRRQTVINENVLQLDQWMLFLHPVGSHWLRSSSRFHQFPKGELGFSQLYELNKILEWRF